jgi:hypothetical protein
LASNDPAERVEIARHAALSLAARQTPDERRVQTSAARNGLQQKFDSAPNPEAARRLHYLKMARASRVARLANKAARIKAGARARANVEGPDLRGSGSSGSS